MKDFSLASGILYRGDSLFCPRGGPVVVNGHAHSLTAERSRKRLTKPPAGASHQRNATFQLQVSTTC